MVPPLIALEEHFFCSELLNAAEGMHAEQFKHIPGLKDKLGDIGELRLSEMAKGKVSMQIVSHACVPGAPTVSQCRDANDELATACKKRPDRFVGFAVLPMAKPDEAVRELERSVKQHGFVGALIDNHVNGTYFDGPEYESFWRTVEQLDVPIYLHPTWPAENMNMQYSGNFTPGASRSIGASGWGWHTETGLHILRLVAAGVFDKFPKLKVVIGHFGEMIPYHFQRICTLSKRWGPLKRGFKQVWDENIWITTSGVWSLDPLRCVLGNTKMDRILFSVDYPFEKNENGLVWMEELEKSGLVSQEQCEMIAYKNAERLFGVNAPQS